MTAGRFPHMPTQNYMTFQTTSPVETHYRKASCAEIDCPAYVNGWSYKKEDLTAQDLYIATHSGRNWREVHIGPGENYIVFDSGQSCFAAGTHVISLERPAFYFVGRGDWRSYVTTSAQQMRGVDWVDRFANHQAKLIEAIERG